MSSLNNYIFLCETESTQVTMWDTIPPTECPNNSLHTINSSTITIIESIPADKNIVIEPRLKTLNNTSFVRLGIYNIPKMKYAIANSVSWMDNSGTSYVIKFFDKTNNVTLLTTTLTNTTENSQNLGVLNNLPNDSIQIEISAKKIGGNSNTKIYIESLTISYN